MKKLLLVLIALFGALPLFAKGYAEYLADAKKYEAQKKWCFALGSYYDALGTNEAPENKKEALEGFKKLKDAIKSGNPGFSKAANEFAIHDEWKNLLCDAEKYASSICAGDISLRLEKGDLDYATKTASYKAFVSWKGFSGRFGETVGVVYEGYGQARKSEWNDLPENWPKYSASYQNNKVYNVNGALVYEERSMISYDEPPSYYNAFFVQTRKGAHFSRGERLYDFTLNIVDKNGKELVKPRRCLCGDENGTIFTGVTSDVMSMIDSGEAFLNPVACYLEYGKYDLSYDKGGGRNFIKPLLEAQIPLDKCVVSRWNGTGYVIEDKIYDNYYATVVLPEKLEQERIEQEQQAKEYEKFVQEYERFKKAVETKAQELIKKGYVLNAMLVPEQIFVMPNSLIGSISRCKEDILFTMIVCCNEKSKEQGLEPVYTISLDGHRLKVSHDLSANGFRLFFSGERSNYNQAQRDGSEIIGEWTSGNNVLVGNWTCNNEKLELVCDNFKPDKFYYNYRDKDYFCFIRSTKKSKLKKK